MTLPFTKSSHTLTQARRIVLKIGSALLMDHQTNTLNIAWMETLGEDIYHLTKQNKEVIIVSSGAIALGRQRLGLTSPTLPLAHSQAAAAAGQIALAHAWQTILTPHNITVAQVLLTFDDTEERRRYLNARNTLSTLLELGVIPVINENDTVSTEEIRYGDNDRLAARITSMISADCLILLSDIDGLYTLPPQADNRQQNAQHISEVPHITDDIRAMARQSTKCISKGGMITKLEAARIVQDAGASMILANGCPHHPIDAILQNAKTTLFPSHPHTNPISSRKKWISASLKNKGKIYIDTGALHALKTGSSLLPVGITHIEGIFERGDCVAVYHNDTEEIGRGLIEHNTENAHYLIGKKTESFIQSPHYQGRTEMIHRDNFVLHDTPQSTE